MFTLFNGVGGLAMIGTQEIMIIAGVAVLLFGGSKIPELMRGMGQGIKEFKSAANEAADASQAANAPTPPLAQVKAVPQTIGQEVKAVQHEVTEALATAA